jgi:small-conductance mechanosensitive channel
MRDNTANSETARELVQTRATLAEAQARIQEMESQNSRLQQHVDQLTEENDEMLMSYVTGDSDEDVSSESEEKQIQGIDDADASL